MLATLTLAVALAAPVPPDARPAGPPPQIVELLPDSDGKVRLSVTRTHTLTRKVRKVANGKVETVEQQYATTRTMRVELTEVKDLEGFTADGKAVDRADLLKRVGGGGTVVVTADGRKVDPKYLRLFRDDTLVLVSPELKGRTAAIPSSAIERLGGAQVAPGRIQIQFAPAVQPAPAPAPRR